jgi:hypothetical protein
MEQDTGAAPLLSPRQTIDLASLLGHVSMHVHLGQPSHSEADYWASHLGPTLDVEDAQVIASLLEDVAGSPRLPEPVQQWARAWAATIIELTTGR